MSKKEPMFPKAPVFCEARTYKDGKRICVHGNEECIYSGNSPSYKCSIYPKYQAFKMECDRFFAWRRRVNKCQW